MDKVTASACTWREEGGGEAAAARILPFLEEIGIEVDWIGDQKEQLLGGLAIVEGRILIDPETPVWPGDLLHEAGHVAVVDAADRPTLGPLVADPTDEMARSPGPTPPLSPAICRCATCSTTVVIAATARR